MLDTTTITHQRSNGEARVRILGRDRIAGLFQRGSAKVMMPRSHGPAPEVVFLNTSGGLTGGDRLDLSLELGPGATALAATQTAERAYAASEGTARVDVAIRVGAGAVCCWLPQETILFDGSSLTRRTLVDLGEGARFLGIEMVVLGRAAMGEELRRLHFDDVRRVRGASGRILHAEQVALNTVSLTRRGAAAGLGGHRVFASLVCIGDGIEDRIGPVRRLLNGAEGVAASAWDGRLVVRALGDDVWSLRKFLAPVIADLGLGAVPRVWQM